jgi:hypothetical protein
MMQEGPEVRKGRGIEEQADSLELEDELHSTSFRECGIQICITEHPSTYFARIALYHISTNDENLHKSWRAPLTFPDLRSRNSTRLWIMCLKPATFS